MIAAELLKEHIVTFVNNKLTEVLGTGFIAKAVRPAIVIYMKNNIDKVDGVLKFLSDKDGNIDAINLINQYEDTILNDDNVTTFNGLGGSIDLGGGRIKISHSYLDKNIIFDETDVTEFKELLTPKTTNKDVIETQK